MNLTTVNLNNLKPYPTNPNTHPDHQLGELARSLEQFDQVKNIVIWQGHIIAGHGLVSAAKRQGKYELQAVDVSDWPQSKAEAFMVADNRLPELAVMDFEALNIVLSGFDDPLEIPGIDEDFLKTLDFGGNGQVIEDEPSIDQAAELQEKWQVRPGDLWALGEHRLVCGDCTDRGVVERAEASLCLMMVTDPPYGVEYDPNWRNEAAKAGFLSFSERRIGVVNNDDRLDWSDAYRLFPGDVAYTWSPGGDPVILTGLAIQRAGFEIRNQIMWSKPHFPISRGHYTYQHEPCWYAVRKGRKSHWVGDLNASTVWRVSLDKNVEGGHSTQKPVELMARPIRNHDSEYVYDPFLGSGTTLIACEQLNRKCRAIEIEPKYCAVALERWHKLTGETPERM